MFTINTVSSTAGLGDGLTLVEGGDDSFAGVCVAWVPPKEMVAN